MGNPLRVYETNDKVKKVQKLIIGGDMVSFRLALSRVILLQLFNNKLINGSRCFHEKKGFFPKQFYLTSVYTQGHPTPPYLILLGAFSLFTFVADVVTRTVLTIQTLIQQNTRTTARRGCACKDRQGQGEYLSQLHINLQMLECKINEL